MHMSNDNKQAHKVKCAEATAKNIISFTAREQFALHQCLS